MKASRYALAWLAATLAVTVTAWAVVAAASGQVTDSPIAPIVDAGAQTTFGSTPTTLGTTSSSAFATSTVDGSPTSSTPTTPPGGSTSTTVPGTIPSTTIPGGSTTSSTTTTSGSTTGTKTVTTAGGTVKVSYSNGDVFLDSASPAIGYTMDVEDTGPDKVKVEFKNDENEVSVTVEWKNGKLDIEIEE